MADIFYMEGIMESQIEQLKRARKILAETYIAGFRHTSSRGEPRHCAIGALEEVAGRDMEFADLMPAPVAKSCRRLFPDAGEIASRLFMMDNDLAVVAAVNNHYGKAAILACFDEAILQLELAAINREFAERPPEPSPVPEPEPEPVLA